MQEFFCLNDPPGPYDSLEESRVSNWHMPVINRGNKSRKKLKQLPDGTLGANRVSPYLLLSSIDPFDVK